MRSNGNCRGISYWEYERTGNTATAVPVTVYNPESIGRRGSPLPSARSTIRSSRFGDSQIETWSRISRYFQSQIFSFGVSKRNLVEKKRAPEKKEGEEEVAREGQKRGGEEEEEEKKGRNVERGGARRRKGLELRLRWKRDSRWSWNRSIRSSRPTAAVAAAGALRYIEAATEKSGTALLRIEATH